MALPTKVYNDISGYSIPEFDAFLIKHWEYFTSPFNRGYSNCSTKLAHKFAKRPSMDVVHNCVGLAWGLWYLMQGITSASEFKRFKANPYELFIAAKNGTNAFKYSGVSTNKPVVGAMVIWGRPSASDGTSRSHIGIVVKVDSKSGYMYVAEDNYSTIRVYGGAKSRNGIRKIRINGAISSNYPLIGYILPIYNYNNNVAFTTTSNLRLRKYKENGDVILIMPKNAKVYYCGIMEKRQMVYIGTM